MSMQLATGLPGAGKTNLTLTDLRAFAEREGRPVFYSGFRDCTIPGWVEIDPKTWMQCPPGSIVLLDECHKLMPPRQRGSEVPKWIEELAEHRGAYSVDVWLITQHPTNMDTFVRKLVERHVHFVRVFGTLNVRMYEFPDGCKDYPEKAKKAKEGVILHQRRINKAAYAWYKSAEVHTVKRRIPMKFWLMIGAFASVPVFFALVYWRVWVHHSGIETAAASVPGARTAPVASATRVVLGARADGLAAAAYLEAMRPRIPGLAFTAPAYDQLTKPVEAPYPSVCAYSPDFPCRCWSQRGFRLEVPKNLCEQLAKEPMDPYWLRRGPHGLERPGDSGGTNDLTDQSRQAAVSPGAQAQPVLAVAQ